jgi:hypothetical protein
MNLRHGLTSDGNIITIILDALGERFWDIGEDGLSTVTAHLLWTIAQILVQSR